MVEDIPDIAPNILKNMNDETKKILMDDLKNHGSVAMSLTINQMAKQLGMSKNRAHRLKAYVSYVGPHIETHRNEDVAEKSEKPVEIGSNTVFNEDGSMDIGVGSIMGNINSIKQVRNLEELMLAADIDATKWESDGQMSIRTWPTTMRIRQVDSKTKVRMSDKVVTILSWYVSAKFRQRRYWTDSPPNWGEPIKREHRNTSSTTKTAIVIPDMHIGYMWSDNYQKLIPLHDWDAIDCVLQLINIIKPDVIQHLGDDLDNAEFSQKFRVPLALKATADPSIYSMHAILRMERMMVPYADIDCIEGNPFRQDP